MSSTVRQLVCEVRRFWANTIRAVGLTEAQLEGLARAAVRGEQERLRRQSDHAAS